MFQLSKQLKEKKGIKILLSLGSNKGNSVLTLQTSVELLKFSGIIYNIKVSSFYKTSPVGFTAQNDFINIALIAETNYSAEHLLFFIKSAEYLLGRQKRAKWHEREIDIDILLYGEEIINSEKLSIPHKEFSKRKFALLPANEIAPEYYHPVLKKNINELLREYTGNEKVIRI
jgi:2-amino-4-hydroxy-6-hydroxymethyldihydropteridine diphosphokinase